MRLLSILALSISLLSAQPNVLTPKEVADGWILLFDGESLWGWTQEGKAQWRAADGVVIADAGDYGWLRSNSEFADYILKCDFRTAADGNSGIFLRSAKAGQPHETGYELQIFDKHPKFPTGSLVEYVRAKPVHPAPGEWHSYEVLAQGDRFVVRLDGKKILDASRAKSKVGHIGLQYNKDKKIEFRNVKLKPLGLKPIFDGKSLSGWQEVIAPRPREKPIWKAANKMIHVEKGPGQLETTGEYADYVLQLDVRANSQDPNRHPNSGVFLRGDPKGYWSGYEVQVRNEFKDGDRTKAVDFGTGGVYNMQPARKVVGTDNEFYTQTIVIRGRHIATWVNGYPVADWEDTRTEGPNARREARLKGGPISLQAHDPTTNLDFKNLRIATVP